MELKGSVGSSGGRATDCSLGTGVIWLSYEWGKLRSLAVLFEGAYHSGIATEGLLELCSSCCKAWVLFHRSYLLLPIVLRLLDCIVFCESIQRKGEELLRLSLTKTCEHLIRRTI